jgi:hypothetical protein
MSTSSDRDRKKGIEKDAEVLSQLGEDSGTVIESQALNDNTGGTTTTTASKSRLEQDNYEAISGKPDSSSSDSRSNEVA